MSWGVNPRTLPLYTKYINKFLQEIIMVEVNLTFRQMVKLVEQGEFSIEDFEKQIKSYDSGEKDAYIIDMLKELINDDIDDSDDLDDFDEDDDDDGNSAEDELEY